MEQTEHSQRLVLGGLETIAIPELGIHELVAKVDTGAFSGALHCTDIAVSLKDGVPTLYYTPLGDASLATSTQRFQEATVRSANGHEESRYLVPVTVVLRGRPYATMLGLRNRAAMRRDMLLGRRFLLEHNALVDVMLTKDIDSEAEEYGI